MTSRLALLPLLLALLCTSPVPVDAKTGQAPVQRFEAKALDAARNAIVSRLDPALPRTSFAAWVRELTGVQAKTEWEVNDCGEQTGRPDVDTGRDFPMCVQVHLTLAGSRDLYVALAVGTFKKGVVADPPSFFYGFVTEPGNPPRQFKSLAEIPAVMRRHPAVGEQAHRTGRPR